MNWTFTTTSIFKTCATRLKTGRFCCAGVAPRARGLPLVTPASVSVAFRDVSEFRFHPRDSKQPFTEDDCLNTFGYWTDEDWADGVILPDPTRTPDPRRLTAIDFMSGAVIIVQAGSVHARVEA